jgi:hypothetical protein
MGHSGFPDLSLTFPDRRITNLIAQRVVSGAMKSWAKELDAANLKVPVISSLPCPRAARAASSCAGISLYWSR